MKNHTGNNSVLNTHRQNKFELVWIGVMLAAEVGEPTTATNQRRHLWTNRNTNCTPHTIDGEQNNKVILFITFFSSLLCCRNGKFCCLFWVFRISREFGRNVCDENKPPWDHHAMKKKSGKKIGWPNFGVSRFYTKWDEKSTVCEPNRKRYLKACDEVNINVR